MPPSWLSATRGAMRLVAGATRVVAGLLATALAVPGAAQYSPYPPAYRAPIFLPEPGHPGTPQAEARPGEALQGGYAIAPPTGYAVPPPGPARPPAQLAPQPAASLAEGLLAPQNAVRAAVGEQPLRWSGKLARAAQQWADHLATNGQFAHSVGGHYGENLYEITGGAATPRQVVAAWAGEAREYNLRTNACSGVCGHYTQIVWRSTRAVGCAVATDPRRFRQVWVCEYDPPGNWAGYRPF